MNSDAVKSLVSQEFINGVPNYLGALLFLAIGWVVINIVVSFIKNSLVKRGADATLIPFVGSLSNSLLKVALIISLLGQVGIKTTSFVAILGTVGLAVGFALRDSLGNFAAGVIVLIFKPIKVGDFIEAGSLSGTVKEIQIFSTIMTTTDNKTITLPNSLVANNAVVNYSTQTTRRVEWIFGIGYNDDFEKAKKIIMEYLEKDERVLKDPEPFVRVSSLGASSVDITARAWVVKENYWPLFHDVIEDIKGEFDRQGISFPFPQREVTVINGTLN